MNKTIKFDLATVSGSRLASLVLRIRSSNAVVPDSTFLKTCLDHA